MLYYLDHDTIGIPLVYHWYTMSGIPCWYTIWYTIGIPLVYQWYTIGIPFGIPFSIPMVYHFIYTTNGIPSPKIGVRLYQVVPFGIPSSTNLVYQMVLYTILVQ